MKGKQQVELLKCILLAGLFGLLLSLHGCMRTPKSMGMQDSTVQTIISTGAVHININVNGTVEKGAVVINNSIYLSSGAIQIYQPSIWGKK